MKYSKYKCRVCGTPMEKLEIPSKGWICRSCFHAKNAEQWQWEKALKKELNTCHVCGGKSQMVDCGKPICFSCWRKAAAKVIAGMRKEGKIK